jgi:hypothetical protein
MVRKYYRYNLLYIKAAAKIISGSGFRGAVVSDQRSRAVYDKSNAVFAELDIPQHFGQRIMPVAAD